MSRARDLADSADKDIVGTLTVDGLTVAGNVSVDGGTIKLDGNYPVGTGNVALGDTALDSNVSGGSNTAIGADALTANTASNNTAVGYQAGYSNVTGTGMVAIGRLAGYNSTASYNTFVGETAGYTNSTGANNTALGNTSLYDNTTGANNTAVGTSALANNTTASNNTAVGYQAGYNATTEGSSVYIGRHAGYNANGLFNTFVGNESGLSVTSGVVNTFVGYDSGSSITTGSKNVIIGNYNGNEGGLDIRTSSNNIVLSDGDGNPRGYYQYANGTDSLWQFVAFSSGQNCMQIKNTATSFPYGPQINFLNNAPNNTSQYLFECADYLSPRFRVWSNGNVVNINNSYGALSDKKLKENIIDASSQWDDIKALKVRKYSMKADNLDAPNMLGVIAQEVEAVGMGGLVFESPDLDSDLNDLGTVTKQVNYSVLYMKAVKALQEAMDRIETLEAKVTALENP